LPYAAHSCGLAECAAHGAAHLARQAERMANTAGAALDGHDDRFCFDAVSVLKQKLSCFALQLHCCDLAAISRHIWMTAVAMELSIQRGLVRAGTGLWSSRP